MANTETVVVPAARRAPWHGWRWPWSELSRYRADRLVVQASLTDAMLLDDVGSALAVGPGGRVEGPARAVVVAVQVTDTVVTVLLAGPEPPAAPPGWTTVDDDPRRWQAGRSLLPAVRTAAPPTVVPLGLVGARPGPRDTGVPARHEMLYLNLGAAPGVLCLTGDGAALLAAAYAAAFDAADATVPTVRCAALFVVDDLVAGYHGRSMVEACRAAVPLAREAGTDHVVLLAQAPEVGSLAWTTLVDALAQAPQLRAVLVGEVPGAHWTVQVDEEGLAESLELGTTADSWCLPDAVAHAVRRGVVPRAGRAPGGPDGTPGPARGGRTGDTHDLGAGTHDTEDLGADDPRPDDTAGRARSTHDRPGQDAPGPVTGRPTTAATSVFTPAVPPVEPSARSTPRSAAGRAAGGAAAGAPARYDDLAEPDVDVRPGRGAGRSSAVSAQEGDV